MVDVGDAARELLDGREQDDLLQRFTEELKKPTGDGKKKRRAGTKPPWYRDDSHEAAVFSHLMKWKRGERVDEDSGAHPLVHAAWRLLAIACRETGNTPVAHNLLLAEADAVYKSVEIKGLQKVSTARLRPPGWANIYPPKTADVLYKEGKQVVDMIDGREPLLCPTITRAVSPKALGADPCPCDNPPPHYPADHKSVEPSQSPSKPLPALSEGSRCCRRWPPCGGCSDFRTDL